MTRILVQLQNRLNDAQTERGATGVEYGIMVAAIAAVIVVLAFAIGVEVQKGFTTVKDALVAGN